MAEFAGMMSGQSPEPVPAADPVRRPEAGDVVRFTRWHGGWKQTAEYCVAIVDKVTEKSVICHAMHGWPTRYRLPIGGNYHLFPAQDDGSLPSEEGSR